MLSRKDGVESALHSPELKMIYANIRAVGFERTTQATDSGQKTNPPVAEGCVAFSQRQLDAGFITVEISRMAATIPHKLIS
jgi:hypothetical protein